VLAADGGPHPQPTRLGLLALSLTRTPPPEAECSWGRTQIQAAHALFREEREEKLASRPSTAPRPESPSIAKEVRANPLRRCPAAPSTGYAGEHDSARC
jgi:hypothetical protein